MSMNACSPDSRAPTSKLLWITNLPYGKADGRPLLLNIICPYPMPATPRPAVIWVHGGGWTAGDRWDGHNDCFCPLLVRHGFVAATIEYRLMPHARFPAQLHDVKAAIRWLRANTATFPIDPDRIGIWGFSAGACLAALAGLTGDVPELEGDCGSPGYSSQVQAVAVGAVPADLLEYRSGDLHDFLIDFLAGTPEERADLWRRASPIYHVHKNAPPFLIAHGTRDELIPFAQAQRLAAALAAAGGTVELIPIEGVYHNWTTQIEVPEGGERECDLGPLALPFFQRHLHP